MGGPFDAFVSPRLTPGLPGRLFVRVGASGPYGPTYLWRSDDSGTTWKDLQPGLERPVSALAVDPTNPEVIWAWTTDSQLWRSADAGATWSQRPAAVEGSLPNVVQLLVDPRHPDTLYRAEIDADGPRVAVSRDGGATFAPGALLARSYVDLGSLRIQPARGELLEFTERGLVVSVNGGRTWKLRSRYGNSGFNSGDIAASAPDTQYAISSDFHQCLVRSEDDGAHWQAATYPHLPSAGCNGVLVDPRDALHVWLAVSSSLGAPPPGYRYYLLESYDGGTSWSKPFLFQPSGIVAAGGETLYTDFGPGLAVSRDGGRTWSRLDRGIIAGDLRSGLFGQRPPGGGAGRRLFGLTSGPSDTPGLGLYRSDGGADWTATGLYPFFFAAAGGSSLAEADYVVRHSPDDGATWQEISPAPRGDPNGFRSDLTQPQHLVLVMYDDIGLNGGLVLWTSDDGGATWRDANAGLPAACLDSSHPAPCPNFDAFAVDPFGPSRRWVTTDVSVDPPRPTVFVSRDAGSSWQVATTAIPRTRALAADPAVANRLLAGTEGGLFASTDGGDHWLPLGDLPVGAVIRQFARDSRSATWYAATVAHGIFRSLDGGAHWALLAGAPDHDNPAIAIDPRKPTALLAAFAGQGVWRWTP